MVLLIIWKYIPLYILVTSLIFVDCVERHLHEKQKLEIMKEHILASARSNVNSVAQHLHNAQTYSPTKEPLITTTNGISATYVQRDSKDDGMFNISEDILAD